MCLRTEHDGATVNCIQFDKDSNSIDVAHLSVALALFAFHFLPKPLLALSGIRVQDGIDRCNTVSNRFGNAVTVVVADEVADTTRDK